MTTAIAVGAVGVYAMAHMEIASLHIKPFEYVGILVGAVFFGAGMTVLGYCPGTSVAACGEGRRDAMIGVVGMLCGAGVYVLGYPWWKSFAVSLGSMGEITMPVMLNIPPWIVIFALIALICGVLGIVVYLERRGVLREARPTDVPRKLKWDRIGTAQSQQHTT